MSGVPATHLVPRGEIFFDCDAAAGHLTGWSQKITPEGSAKGALFIAETRAHDIRHFARVGVTGRERGTRAGFELFVADGDRALGAQLRFSNDTTVAAEPGELPIGGTVFALRWTKDQLELQLQKGGVWNPIPLSFEPERFWLECSSANAVFYTVSITSRPASTAPPSAASPADPPASPPQP